MYPNTGSTVVPLKTVGAVLRGTARKKEQQRETNNGTITEEEKPLRRKLTVNSAMPSSGRID